MKEIKYVPSVCKPSEPDPDDLGREILAPTYEGFVVLSAPTYDERMDYLDRCGVDIDSLENLTKKEQIRMTRNVVAMTKHHYLKVELKRKSDGIEFKSFDDMDTDTNCAPLISEVGLAIFKGFGPDPK